MEAMDFLDNIYKESMELVGSDDKIKSDLNQDIAKQLSEILSKSESAKAVITVILTSAVYKALHPDQDIRNHQTSIPNGYSGRTFDSKYITPFMKSVNFPAMAESGWLTRSLEQKVRGQCDLILSKRRSLKRLILFKKEKTLIKC
jgi:DNA (cytosine-5)-methyltransferase 1